MKKISSVTLLFVVVLLASCNMYKWERKQFYKKDPTKNWNYIKPTPTQTPVVEPQSKKN